MRTFPVTAKSVTCKAGELFAVEAIGPGATGFEWFVEIETDGQALELKTRSLTPEDSPGAMGLERFEFVAHHSGRVEVVFELRRPWATQTEKSFKLHITVR